jgi:hypothetical protein
VRLNETNVLLELFAYHGLLERLLVSNLDWFVACLAHPVAIKLGWTQTQTLVALEQLQHGLVQQIAQHILAMVFAMCSDHTINLHST